jgi:hypothetical protein
LVKGTCLCCEMFCEKTKTRFANYGEIVFCDGGYYPLDVVP